MCAVCEHSAGEDVELSLFAVVVDVIVAWRQWWR